MKFADIENVWSVDVKLLSNADRGRVYYERSKQVIGEALTDPKERLAAVAGRRFSRAYLVKKIGCTASVLTQNPKIRAILTDADGQVAAQASGLVSVAISKPHEQIAELSKLRTAAAALQRRVDKQAKVIAELRRKLRECR
jgi:cytidylate kinase